MRKEKVLFVLGGMDRAGAEAFVMTAVRHLDRKKITPMILTFLAPKNGQRFEYQDELDKLGVKMLRVKDTRFSKPWQFVRDIKKIVQKEKITVVHSNIDFMSGLVLLAAKLGGAKKRVAHAHSTNGAKVESLTGKIAAKILRTLIFNNATALVACGKDAGEFLFQKHPFVVIKNGIELEQFAFRASKRKSMRKKYQLADGLIVLLNAARMEPVKNQHYLLELMAAAKQKKIKAKLFLLGDGSLKDTLKKEITLKNLTKEVILLPTQANIADFYMMSDVFVMSSLAEGLSVSCVEAQATGLKTLLSDHIAEETKLLDDTLFLPITDTGKAQWLKEIQKIHSEKVRAKAIEEKRVRVFDGAKMARSLEELYVRDY